jgi:ABC-type sugar transport system permease subunit/ABC-type glycerol-3-phosphate transport system substrate-binding protein
MRVNTILTVMLLFVGAAGSAFPADEPPVELQFWTSPSEVRKMAEIFEKYELENPGVKVVIGQSAARNLVEDPQRVLCAIVGGDPPDIIVFDRYAVGEWAARDAFMPLDDFIAADANRPDGIKKDEYYAPCWEEATYKGKLYGIPISTDNRALYYNKDMLIRAGYVNEKNEALPPRSWKELREYAVKLSEWEGEGSKRRLTVAGFVPNFGNSWLYLYGWQNKAKFMSDDGKTCLLNEPHVVEALTFMKDMYNDLGGAGQVYAFQTGLDGNERDPFLTGKIAMKIDGNWSLGTIAAYKPDMNFGVAPAPMPDASDAPISWLGGWAWVIPKGARHPREAWALIRRLASMETALHQAEVERRNEVSQGRTYIPGLNANRKITEAMFKKYMDDEPSMDASFKVGLKTFIDLLPRSKYRPVTPVGQRLWNQQVEAFEKAIFALPGSSVTPQSALDAGTAIVQRELDRIEQPETGPVVSWPAIALLYFGVLAVALLVFAIWFMTRFTGKQQARQEAYAGWAFASPWIFGFIVFTGGPILCSLIMAFCTYDALNPSHFVGVRNFQETLTQDPLLWQSLWNTVFMVLGVPLGMMIGLGVAMLLDANVRHIAVYRTLFYLPSIVPGVASALLWILIFKPNEGILNWALLKFGVSGPNWLQDPLWSKPALIVQGLWGAGAGMIVWLAGLKAIPPDLYEAAALDGANAFRRFWHITLPMLTPYIFFNLVMGLIGTFQIFGPAYLMTQGGPVNSTLFYAYNLFNQSFRFLHMGYAGALAWILFAIIFVLTLYQLSLSKRWVHYQGE